MLHRLAAAGKDGVKSRLTPASRPFAFAFAPTHLRHTPSHSNAAIGASRRSFSSSSSSSAAAGGGGFTSAFGNAAPPPPGGGSGPSFGPDPDGDLLPQVAEELMPLILAILLYNSKSDNPESHASSTSADIPLVLFDSGDKGIGALASRDLARGEVILSEQPLIVWPEKTSKKEADKLVAKLTPRAKEVFYSLANTRHNGHLSPNEAIRDTNAFAVQMPTIPLEAASTAVIGRFALASAVASQRAGGGTEDQPCAVMLFPRIARLNHSCLPTADCSVDWSKLRMTIYATTDIKEGSEVSIEYTWSLLQKTRAERKKVMKEKFGFECRCTACALGGEEGEKSDARRREIDQIVKRTAKVVESRSKTLQDLGRLRSLIKEEGYLAMPEFDEPKVTAAYHVYVRMQQEQSSP